MPQSEGGNGGQAERYRLPSGNIEQGRSQPKRSSPRRVGSQKQLLKRLALGVATFFVALEESPPGKSLRFSESIFVWISIRMRCSS